MATPQMVFSASCSSPKTCLTPRQRVAGRARKVLLPTAVATPRGGDGDDQRPRVVRVITFMFAVIYKLLPDVKIAWRNVWTGAWRLQEFCGTAQRMSTSGGSN
jgi:hypothetical protein